MFSLRLDISLDALFNSFGILSTELLLQNAKHLLDLVSFLAQHLFLTLGHDALRQTTLVGRDLVLQLFREVWILFCLIDLLVQFCDGVEGAFAVGFQLGGPSLSAFFANDLESYCTS